MNNAKVVLVTGGTRGIGAAITKRFLISGAKVISTYKNDQKSADLFFSSLSSVEKKNCQILQLTANNPQNVKTFFQNLDNQYSHIDILINNAGSMKGQLTTAVSEAEFDQLISDNLKSTFFVTQQTVKRMMLKKSGKIINISSIAAQCSQAGQSVYAAAKGGVESLTKAWAIEFAPFNINVNAVAPGLVDAGMIAQTSEKIIQQQIQLTPLGRIANTADVVAAVYWLSSDEANFITGQVLAVNGGVFL